MVMSWFLVQRAAASLLALFGVITLVFALLHLSGDPAVLLVPPDASRQQLETVRHLYHLDEPIGVQYLEYLGALARGDLGFSYRYNEPVAGLIRERVAATLELASAGLVVTLLFGLPLGMIAAVRFGSAVDISAMLVSLVGLSIPGFWLGLMMIVVFGVLLRWLPVSGFGGWQHLVMPSIVLGSFFAAELSRLARASLVEALTQDYIRTARAKGLEGRVVFFKHALKNAALPVLTALGLDVGRMLSGAVVTETIFAWPGMGRLAVQSVLGRDFPVVQGVVIVGAATFLGVNLLVDLAYGWFDPRLSH